MDNGSSPPESSETTLDRLPRHTTPTWEVELLISGVAVFAMLQLPGWLDDRWFALRPRLDASWLEPLGFIYVYAKSGVMVLATTFVVHLLMRARWIALVGMHSVYPAGIDWTRLRMGPVQREVEQRHYGSAESTIDRADNSATIVFAIGVMLASLLLVLSIFLLVVYAAAHWLVARFALQLDPGKTLLWIIAIVLLPIPLAVQFDRRFGSRVTSGGKVHALLARVFGVYGRLGMGQAANPTIALLSSRSSRLRTTLATMAIVIVAVMTAVMSYKIASDPSRFGSYALFPRMEPGSGQSFDAAHYDDARNPDRDAAVPYIQAAVITGPYLHLVVPYRPVLDDPALQHDCKDAGAADNKAAELRFACLQRLHAVTLDGEPVRADFVIGSDPRTDRPALVAMIDVRALAAGRHLLSIAQPALPNDPETKPMLLDRIAFWR
jgi:hypothetical protein